MKRPLQLLPKPALFRTVRLTTALLSCGLLACGLPSPALAAPTAPVPGSSRPDAYARAGAPLTLSVPEVAGRTVNVGGVPATIQSERVTVNIPPGTPPGRTVLRFVGAADGQLITTREIDVLPAPTPDVQERRVQLTLAPGLSPARVRAILDGLSAVGALRGQETLPAALGAGGSPCGATVAELDLGAGVALEAALNLLLEVGGNDVWYPDPISSWSAPAFQTTAQTTAQPAPRSFQYVPSPVVPRQALGVGAAPTTLRGAGVVIAVLDTGYSPALDLHGELSGRVDPPMNALRPFDPALTFRTADTQDFWEGHGTQVAILAAGAARGVAPQARVLPVKVCAEGEAGRATCTTRDVLRGVCFALSQVPARKLVLNLSLGGGTPTGAIHAALNWALRQGAVVVAAGGNQGERGSPREYPAAFAQGAGTQAALPLLAVASVTPRGNTWDYSAFSTRGAYLNISAPGEALDLGHPFLYSGTSFAAPLVAGAAALVKGASLNASAEVVRAFLLAPARTRNFPGLRPMLDLRGY